MLEANMLMGNSPWVSPKTTEALRDETHSGICVHALAWGRATAGERTPVFAGPEVSKPSVMAQQGHLGVKSNQKQTSHIPGRATV